MTVYYDIFFIINLSMDITVLLSVGALLKIKTSFFASLFAASLTSLVAVAQTVFAGDEFFAYLIALSSQILACAIVFKGIGLLKFLWSFLLFSSFSSLISHAVTKLFLIVGRPESLRDAGGSGGIIPLAVCATSSLLSVLFKYLFSKRKRRKSPQRTRLTIVSEDKSTVLSAYCDSGNLLREPIGGLPVMITGENKMREIVPRALHGVFFSSDGYLGETSLESARRVRIIPIMPVGTGGARILFGYVPDKIELDGDTVEACVALDTGNSNFGGCDALLPKSLIK